MVDGRHREAWGLLASLMSWMAGCHGQQISADKINPFGGDQPIQYADIGILRLPGMQVRKIDPPQQKQPQP